MAGAPGASRRGRAPRVVPVAAGLAIAWLLGPLALAATAGAKQPLRAQVAGRPRPAVPRPVVRPSPWLDGDADQEQLGEPIDSWGGEVGVAVPGWARSIEVGSDGAPVRSLPGVRGSERRGRLGPGMRFPLLDRWHGPGCAGGPWYRVGAGAWVCASDVSLSQAAPTTGPYPVLARDQIVPFEYAFSGGGGVRAYARANDASRRSHAGSLGARWGLAIVAHERWRGRAMARTTRGSWVAARALRWVRPSHFAGAGLAPDQPATRLAIAWVRPGGAPTYDEPGDRRHAGLPGRTMVEVADEVRQGGRAFTRLGDGRFVESRNLVRPVRLAVPDGVAAGERWIHVDLARQTLVAYEGDQPIFATLVSTGREPGTTPRGLHRIRIKLAHDTMDNVGDDDAEEIYSMDGVPWIQYFTDGVALHGVYWHDRFGTVRSHGCVNLAPRDARWLYAFTYPQVPDGWAVALPTERERGTPVYVR